MIVFGGLPGTGKTTLARALSQERQATYCVSTRSTIEQALRSSGMLAGDVGPAGYVVAYALAESNLLLGRDVVADSVNPLAITRNAWRRVAAATSSPIVEIEVVCSDVAEHRRRIETRSIDIAGLAAPTWRQVVDREYEPWDRPRIVLDTGSTASRTRWQNSARAWTGKEVDDERSRHSASCQAMTDSGGFQTLLVNTQRRPVAGTGTAAMECPTATSRRSFLEIVDGR